MELDVVIFGGGAAGLWLLDELTRRGARVLLLEAGDLGQGQTVAAQGIIHGGLKYTLQGLLTPSATSIRDMPKIWRDCLAGRDSPNLQRTRVRSEFCYLWHTGSVSSRLGMIGAKFGLRVTAQTLNDEQRPDVLKGCAGTVAQLDEQVIATDSFLEDLSGQHRERILRIDAAGGLRFEMAAAGQVDEIKCSLESQTLTLRPQHVVFTAGAGNAELRRQVGLSAESMQLRPLHMVMLRGTLPQFHGHCVDGAKTRATITSDTDLEGRTVWQIGGQVAEVGVEMEPGELIAHTHSELQAVIPTLDLTQMEWATYRVDRAERVTSGGKRPDTVQMICEGNCTTAWPTKLALAPQLARGIAASFATVDPADDFDLSQLTDWPRPDVALPPWQTCDDWRRLDLDVSDDSDTSAA